MKNEPTLDQIEDYNYSNQSDYIGTKENPGINIIKTYEILKFTLSVYL